MSFSPVPNTIRGGGGGGSVIQCPFPLFQKHWGPSVVFVLMHMSGATTEMPNTLQPYQSFRRTYGALGSQRSLLA